MKFNPPIIGKKSDKVRLMKLAMKAKKDERGGKIYLEGHRLVVDALQYGFSPEVVFLTERAIEAPLGTSLIKALEHYRSNVYQVDEKIMANITSTKTPQG